MASNSAPTQKPPESRSKSCETACSSNSSCFFQRRKPTNPLANSLRNSHSRSTGNSVKQRVLSAKLLKLKSVQNQLNDANFHLAEVLRENQALKNLQKRQDKALSKYEGANAELPRLIQSHEEEIRFLTEKNKQLRKNMKELNEQLKHKNDELVSLQEQLKHFEKLDKDKHLLEREKLIEELEDVNTKLRKADGEIVILNRKLTLESKTSKQRLNMLMTKHKQCQRELAQALTEISRLTKLLQSKDKTIAANGRRRFATLPQRDSTSLISLNGAKQLNLLELAPPQENLNCDNKNSDDYKLEPITPPTKDEEQNKITKNSKGILKSPAESVKARLSADSRHGVDEELPVIDKLNISGSETSNERETRPNRPSSSQKLEKIEMNVQNTIRKIEDNKNSDEFSKRLGDYCLSAISSVKTYNNLIEHHKENLENAKEDTDRLLQTVKDAETLELKLKRQHLVSIDTEIPDDLDFVNQILKDEVEFQIKYPETKKKKEPAVAASDKKKLLATLRAIDNGDNLESFDSNDSKKNNHLIKELFGDVAD